MGQNAEIPGKMVSSGLFICRLVFLSKFHRKLASSIGASLLAVCLCEQVASGRLWAAFGCFQAPTLGQQDV